mmetsp:Transcript_14221/g.19818  ORF Transcript_14221/g.19818 Transcript_14221/m.19818 type:complete len:656 (-) Transcript_14221:1343-3310(-)
MDTEVKIDSVKPPSTLVTPTTSKKNSLEVLIEHWKAINLESRKNELDSQATEIANFKDASLESRKKLAEQTKNFRKVPDEEKIKNFGSLLKLYQEEIDKLTKRSKFSENCFLTMYKLLADAPDPIIGLAAALEESQKSSKVGELDLENRKLRTELEEFRKEFQEVQNQEVTIRRLEDKIADYQSKMDQIIQEKTSQVEQQLKDEFQKTLENLRDREHEAKRQLSAAQSDLSRMQHALDVAQSELLDFRSRYDDKQAAKQSELDMLVEELDRTRQKMLLLEKQRDKLSEQNDFIKSNQMANIHSGNVLPDLELEVAQKDIEITQLKEHIQKIEYQLIGDTSAFKQEISSLQDQLSAEKTKVKHLAEELKARPTTQELRDLQNQLDVFKQAFEYEDDADGHVRTAEKLIKDKNRKLETEIVQLKATLTKNEQEVADLKEKLSKTQDQNNELNQLVVKLEDDISKNSPHLGRNKAVEDILQTKPGKPEDTSMLQIVCNQRDRFKARIQDLEQENRDLQNRIDSLNTQIDTLRHDNIKLYEKTRYLQSYGSLSNKHDIEANRTDTDLENKYSQLYEDTVNPFVIFNRKERYQRYKDLNAAEKVILSSGKFFLSTKFSRTFLFFYSLLLHLLVFLTLYKLAHTTTLSEPTQEPTIVNNPT